jgi:hypothetical protein
MGGSGKNDHSYIVKANARTKAFWTRFPRLINKVEEIQQLTGCKFTLKLERLPMNHSQTEGPTPIHDFMKTGAFKDFLRKTGRHLLHQHEHDFQEKLEWRLNNPRFDEQYEKKKSSKDEVKRTYQRGTNITSAENVKMKAAEVLKNIEKKYIDCLLLESLGIDSGNSGDEIQKDADEISESEDDDLSAYIECDQDPQDIEQQAIAENPLPNRQKNLICNQVAKTPKRKFSFNEGNSEKPSQPSQESENPLTGKKKTNVENVNELLERLKNDFRKYNANKNKIEL